MNTENITCKNKSNVRAGVIVCHNGSLLLIYRRKNNKEYYVFPGGTLESRETIKDAAIRELNEETSIIASPVRLLYYLQMINTSEHSSENFSIPCCKKEYYYLCDYISGIPTLNSDAVEVQRMHDDNAYKPMWVPLEQVRNLLIYPIEIKNLLIADLEAGFTKNIKKVSVLRSNLLTA